MLLFSNLNFVYRSVRILLVLLTTPLILRIISPMHLGARKPAKSFMNIYIFADVAREWRNNLTAFECDHDIIVEDTACNEWHHRTYGIRLCLSGEDPYLGRGPFRYQLRLLGQISGFGPFMLGLARTQILGEIMETARSETHCIEKFNKHKIDNLVYDIIFNINARAKMLEMTKKVIAGVMSRVNIFDANSARI